MTSTDDLAAFRATRGRWVLVLAGLQLGVLAAGLASAVTTGFVAFAALAAAWMFVAVRISRGVIGNRVGDENARRATGRLRLAGGMDDVVPDSVIDALEQAREHRRAALLLSGGAVVVLAIGAVGAVVPSLGPWLFGLALVYVLVGLGWAWSRRAAWTDARALVDAWVGKQG